MNCHTFIAVLDSPFDSEFIDIRGGSLHLNSIVSELSSTEHLNNLPVYTECSKRKVNSDFFSSKTFILNETLHLLHPFEI